MERFGLVPSFLCQTLLMMVSHCKGIFKTKQRLSLISENLSITPQLPQHIIGKIFKKSISQPLRELPLGEMTPFKSLFNKIFIE